MKQYIVIAFRYGGSENTFPIGVFNDREKAIKAAKAHSYWRGGKYNHRIYEFEQDKVNDEIGPRANSQPCIEENK